MESVKKARFVEWQRHDGIESLAIPSFEKRPYLYPSPVLRQDLSELLNYETGNELGISIAISYRLRKPFFYTEVLAKQACWFIKHLCERTDMISEKVPIRFGITTDLYEMVMPYLNACGFPEGLIDWIKTQEALYPGSTKLLAMQHDRFKNVERVLHFDLCYFIETDPTQHKAIWFEQIKERWREEPFVLPYSFSKIKVKDTESRIMAIYNQGWGEDVPAEEHILWTALSKYLDEPPDKLKDHFLIDEGEIAEVKAPLFGFSREQLDKLNLETDIFPVMQVSNDEVALEAYAYRENWTTADVATIETAMRWRSSGDPIDPNVELGIRYTHSALDPELWMTQYRSINQWLRKDQYKGFNKFELKSPIKTRESVKFIENVIRSEHDSILHSRFELDVLYELAYGMHDLPGTSGHIIHCGMHRGGSICVMAQAVRDSGSMLKPVIGIDPYVKEFRRTQPDFRNNACMLMYDNIHKLSLEDCICPILFDDTKFFDMFSIPSRIIFIDSSHLYDHTKEEIRLLLPNLVNNGWLVFHNYAPKEDVVTVVNEFIDNQTDYDLNLYYLADIPGDLRDNSMILMQVRQI